MVNTPLEMYYRDTGMPRSSLQLPESVETSESLLTQILGLLQSVNATVEGFEKKLNKIEKDLADSIKRIDTVIKDGFPDGDLSRHKNWHLGNFVTRLFNK